MREIKFRGKRVDNGEWVYGSLIRKFAKPHKVYIPFGYRIEVNHDEVYEVVPETIGQFTGLKDENGVEVYEGDIITGYPNMHKMEIVWHNACWCVKFKDLGTEYIHPLENEEDNIFVQFQIEVIGNIYENPELLVIER